MPFPSRFRPAGLGIPLVLAALALALASPVSASDSPALAPTAAAIDAPSPAPPPVVVRYFHATIRCETCLALEALSRRTLETRFAAELADGRLEWHVLDFEEPENAALAARYGIEYSALIVEPAPPGEGADWVELEGIWERVDDPDAFGAYVADVVSRSLAGNRAIR